MRVFRSLHTYTPGTMEGWLHRITTNLFLDQARRKQRIRFDALSDEAASRLPSALPDPRRRAAGPHLRRRRRGRPRLARPRLPGRRRPLRRGGPDLRGDRRRPGPQARHRPVAHPPGPRAAALRPRAPRTACGPDPLRRSPPRPWPRRTGAVMLSFSGHIGAKASALVDGQLSPTEEERAWGHVLTCPGCRRLVEHEGWTKRQLGWLDAPGSRGDGSVAAAARFAVRRRRWAAVDKIEQRSRRRRTTAAVVGGGAVAASVLGLITFTGSPVSRTEVPSRPSPAMIRGDQVRGPVGSPTGAETNTAPILARRSR